MCYKLCCCANKSIECPRTHHCYKKCPVVVNGKSRGTFIPSSSAVAATVAARAAAAVAVAAAAAAAATVVEVSTTHVPKPATMPASMPAPAMLSTPVPTPIPMSAANIIASTNSVAMSGASVTGATFSFSPPKQCMPNVIGNLVTGAGAGAESSAASEGKLTPEQAQADVFAHEQAMQHLQQQLAFHRKEMDAALQAQQTHSSLPASAASSPPSNSAFSSAYETDVAIIMDTESEEGLGAGRYSNVHHPRSMTVSNSGCCSCTSGHEEGSCGMCCPAGRSIDGGSGGGVHSLSFDSFIAGMESKSSADANITPVSIEAADVLPMPTPKPVPPAFPLSPLLHLHGDCKNRCSPSSGSSSSSNPLGTSDICFMDTYSTTASSTGSVDSDIRGNIINGSCGSCGSSGSSSSSSSGNLAHPKCTRHGGIGIGDDRDEDRDDGDYEMSILSALFSVASTSNGTMNTQDDAEL